MQENDLVAITVSGEQAGPGRIAGVAGEQVTVIIEQPSGGSYRFGAPVTWLKAVAPGRWHLDMPSLTRSEFMPPVEAEKIGVVSLTIKRLEGGQAVSDDVRARARAALEAAGVEFTNGDQPGVRMRKQTEDGSVVERIFKIGDVVEQRDDLPPADIRRIDMTARIVEQPTLPPSPTHVWVEFADGTVVALDKGRLIHANKR